MHASARRGKAADMSSSEQTPTVLRWGGLLASAGRAAQLMMFVALAVSTAALSFAQMGLVGFGTPETGMIYALVQLVPVSLGAILFGPLRGCLMGLFAGAALLVHSQVQPLDFYEADFITPVSSLVLLAAAGFVQGLLFAALLRGKPSMPRRIASIVGACIAVAVIVVVAFRACVHGTLSADSQLAAFPFNLDDSFGALWAQALIDAVLMSVVCLAADALSRFLMKPEERRGVRMMFRGWLLLVVAVAFMATAGAGYAVVTVQEEQAASELMESEAVYLCNQIQANEVRLEAFARFVGKGLQTRDGVSMDDSIREYVEGPLSLDGLLDGYEEDFDGMVVVFKGETVLLSDSAEFEVGGTMVDYFSEGSKEYFTDMAQSRRLVQTVFTSYDGADATVSEEALSMQVAYMRAAQTGDYTVVIIQPSSMVFADRAGVMMWLTLSALVLLLVVFAASTRLLGRIVAEPIDRVNEVLGRIAEGDLAARSKERSSREFASLSEGVNDTVSALEDQIEQAKENFKRELDAAATIQESALPRAFPPFPDILRFDVYGGMQPARQVGGDFFDFFLIGEGNGPSSGKLGFVVADVSGKGVPAALFMMAAQTAIRGYLESGMEIGEAFENANRKLCEGNDASMFVTAFAGVLDYGTGRMTYVNAGHNAPYFWQDGSWRSLKDKSGLPLGLFDGLPYKSFECECRIGDQLFLYTDGVTEAMNTSDELYGTERLEALLGKCYDLHPRSLVERVRRDVSAFARGAEQADDITMLALEYGVLPEVTATIVVPADDRELPRVTEFVHTELDRRLCPLRAQRQLDIALEELFVNVAHYAYPDAPEGEPGEVRVSYTYSAEPPSITVEIADEGIPFDPLAKPDIVTPKSIEDVQIGGLGILMAKKSVDEMSYERIDGTNVVVITKRW